MPETTPAVVRALIIHPLESVRQELNVTLRQASSTPILVQEAESLTEGLRAARWFDPRYILLDLNEDRSLALDVAREVRASDRRVIGLYNPLLLADREDSFFRSAARAGVGDFVPLPVAADELAAALAIAPDEDRDRGAGKTIAFFGHQGGVGTSTLAVNTALMLAASGEAGEVALCDAALQFGHVAALLGIAPDRDLADMARDLDEMGAVSPYLSQHAETGLRVLSRPRELADAEAVTPDQLSRLLIQLERRFDTVIVDTPPVLDRMTLAVFDLSEEIFLVTEAVAPTIRGTSRLLAALEQLGFGDERLRIVVSQYIGGEGNLPPGTVAEHLGRPVDYVIAQDLAFVAAANQGTPMILSRRRGDYAEVIGQIAGDAIRGRSGS